MWFSSKKEEDVCTEKQGVGPYWPSIRVDSVQNDFYCSISASVSQNVRIPLKGVVFMQ